MKRALALVLVLALAAGASAAERRRKGKKPKAAPSPAASPSPSAAVPPEPSPLDAPLKAIAGGKAADVEKEGRDRVAKDASDAVGHAMIGLAVRARAAKARFPAGVPAPKGQDPSAWDQKAVDEATAELTAALERDPKLAPAAAALVDMLARTLRGDKALEIVRAHAAAFAPPGAASALEGALELFREKGQGEQALAIADFWIEKRPDDPIARRSAARTQELCAGLERARATIRGYRSRSKDPLYALYLGEVEVLAGQPAKAVALFASIAAPVRRAGWLAVLSALAAGDRKAPARLKAIAATAMPGEEHLAELGWLLDGALAKPPSTQAAQLEETVKAHVAARRPVEAALALAARRRLPDAGAAVMLLDADIAVAVRDWAREDRLVRPLIGKNAPGAPADGQLLFRVGRALFHQNRNAQAEADWKKALAAGKDDAELNFHLGRVRERMGKRDEALAHYTRAATCTGPGPHAQLARDALARLGVK